MEAIGIVSFTKLTAAQRESAAEILVAALAHAPGAWKTMDAARNVVARLTADPK